MICNRFHGPYWCHSHLKTQGQRSSHCRKDKYGWVWHGIAWDVWVRLEEDCSEPTGWRSICRRKLCRECSSSLRRASSSVSSCHQHLDLLVQTQEVQFHSLLIAVVSIRWSHHTAGFLDTVRSSTPPLMMSSVQWLVQLRTFRLFSVRHPCLFNQDIMQGEDINDSNCINFSNISKIRDHRRLSRGNKRPLKGLRVGIVQEFEIDELD